MPKKLFGASSQSYGNLFNQYLAPSYQYFINASQTATDIFMQTMMMNALSDGIRDYASSSNAEAGLQNYITTKAELQTRSTFQAYGAEATVFLPLMQTLLLLIYICAFPLVAALSLVAANGFPYWTSFLRYLVWVELWPPLFAIINMAMNFYLQKNSLAFQADSVSMNTFSQLTQMHRDTMAMAGYLSLSVPLIARGLVSNTMLESVSSMATGLLGGLQSATGTAAQEATTGNFNLGTVGYRNVNANNINMNKHDTDAAYNQGTVSEQMASGVIKTSTEDGQVIYNQTPAMSTLAQSLNLGSQLSSTLSHSAEQMKSAAVSESQNVQSGITSTASKLAQFGGSSSHDLSVSEGASRGLSATETHAYNTLQSAAKELSHNENISMQEAYRELGQMTYGVGANVDSSNSASGKVAEWMLGAKVNASATATHQDSSSAEHNYNASDTHGFNDRQTHDIAQSFNTLASHQKTESTDARDSHGSSLIDNIAADLRTTNSASHNMNADFTQSQRLSEMATLAETNSASINSNLSQEFVNFVKHVEGEKQADALFANPGLVSSRVQLETLAHRFVSQTAQEAIVGNYEGFKANINPEGFYSGAKHAVDAAGGTTAAVTGHFEQDKQTVMENQKHFVDPTAKSAAIRGDVDRNLEKTQHKIQNEETTMKNFNQKEKEKEQTMANGKKDAERTSLPFDNYIKKKIEAVKKISIVGKTGSIIDFIQKNKSENEDK